MTQTYVFGGAPAQPSQVSYSALSLTANTQLAWPWVDQDTDSAVPLYLYVTPTGAFAVLMPDATGAANGQAIIIFNVGASTITILDSTGMSIVTITAGIAKYIILQDNSTAAGTWQSITFGAGTNAADAGALAGFGLSALSGAMLNSNQTVSAVTGNITAGANYRAQVFEVTAATGAGTLSFASVNTLGNGWWMGFSNLGTGAWTLDPNGSETIDGNSTIVLNPTETCLIFSSGAALYTIGRGRSVDFLYTALNKDVSGNTDVVLTSTEAGNLLIKLFGTLTGNINLIVPSVVNEYMIRNATSGAFTVTVKTSSGAGIVATQGEQAFIKCDGTDCFNVVTNIPVAGAYAMPDGSVSIPGLAFASEITTGFSRPTAGALAVSVLGNEIFRAVASGITMNATAITGLSGLTVTSADAGASVAPIVTTFRNSASPAANDIIGGLNFDGNNSTPAEKTYASIQSTILDPTAASEDATMDFLTVVAGALAKRGGFGQGLIVGAATDNGPGTISATGGIFAAGATLTAAETIAGTAATLLTVTQTDAGAALGPQIILDRSSASPITNDLIGTLTITGRNTTPATVTYAEIVAQINDATAASEDGALLFKTAQAGTKTTALTLATGAVVGSPTGGDKGTGTVNATGYFLNGAVLSSSGYSAKTSGYTIISTDANSVINFTTAGDTAALTSAATLGAGFRVTIMNTAASGDVTIDPAGSETLDSLTTRALRPGDRTTIVSNGTNWLTATGQYSYFSPQQTITLSSELTLAHGLGKLPTLMRLYLVNSTGASGYSAGDRIWVAADQRNINNGGVSISMDATNLYLSTGTSNFYIIPKAGGAAVDVSGSLTNWRLVAEAVSVN